jgi:2-deoxy-D-gluconate 3-dehydrogenase
LSVQELFGLEGRAALVTGAGRGIGRALALGLAKAGADVCLVGRGVGLDEAAREVEGAGRRAAVVNADLSDPSSAARVVAEAEAALGRVDILVNNAGVIRRAPFLEHTETDWDAVLNVNLKSVFLLSQAAARGMAERGAGKIVNVASLLSFQGGLTVAAYAASKGAVAQLTKAAANELAARGVNVNAVAPGYVATDNTAALRADPVRSRQILERIPAGRWGAPEDLVGAVIFLASRASDYVHGHTLVVDGGWLAR